MKERVTISIPEKVLKEIERRRGKVPRSRYISDILEEMLFDELDKNQHRLEFQ